MMKTILTAMSLLASTQAFSEINVSCWDGTFGYNYAHVVETSRGVEVTLTGGTLELPTFYPDWGQTIGWTFSGSARPTLHILFPNKPTVEGDHIILTDEPRVSEGSTDVWSDRILPTLYLELWTKSLGESKRTITDIELITAKLDIAPNSLALTISQANVNGHPLETISLRCMGSGQADTLVFPKALTDHLDTIKH